MTCSSPLPLWWSAFAFNEALITTAYDIGAAPLYTRSSTGNDRSRPKSQGILDYKFKKKLLFCLSKLGLVAIKVERLGDVFRVNLLPQDLSWRESRQSDAPQNLYPLR
jgi:hypothetical protein